MVRPSVTSRLMAVKFWGSQKYSEFLSVWGVSALNPLVAQGSTVVVLRSFYDDLFRKGRTHQGGPCWARSPSHPPMALCYVVSTSWAKSDFFLPQEFAAPVITAFHWQAFFKGRNNIAFFILLLFLDWWSLEYWDACVIIHWFSTH